MTTINPYEVMGLERDATAEEIKRAYRDLAKSRHPDAGGVAAEWERLKLAYDVLSDPDRRSRYDATGVIDDLNPEHERHQAGALVAELISVEADKYVRSDFSRFADPRTKETLATIQSQVSRDVISLQRALEVGRKSLTFLQDYAGRFKRRAEANGIDHIGAILQQKIVENQRRIIAVEEQVRVREIALDLLADYAFERDDPGLHKFNDVEAAGVGHFMERGR